MPRRMLNGSAKPPTSRPQPSHIATEPLPKHSEPMVIPPRSRCPSAASSHTMRTRGHSSSSSRKGRMPGDHKADSLPPAVAALLAVTAIPPRRTGSPRRRSAASEKHISIDELVQEWREESKSPARPSYNSPLDILLENPDDSEIDDGSSIGGMSDKERDYTSARSISSESLPSVPSLEPDVQSLDSWSSPATPRSVGRRSVSERKEKTSSLPKEDCALDHPLLGYASDNASPPELPALDTSPPPKSTLTAFKSNLTASFQALKSAARSFSNFTAPSVPPDDLLTRSILSPRFASEMRPKPTEGVPSPAMRRYLNPASRSTPAVPVTELSNHFHQSTLLADLEEIDAGAPMIQLQTYDRRGGSKSKSKRRSVSPMPAPANHGNDAAPVAVRQREPRENSDFLRVIVLEMNMRRGGKLDPKAPGKARIWLPPRKPCARNEEQGSGGGKEVPERWVGLSAEDV